MKLSDIVYPLTKPNVEFAISIYLRKIFYSNSSRIPKDQPVLFLSNHPTAFLEPVIYSGLLDKPIHSLVRGDFFQNSTAKVALESLNMVAIYRMRDGGVEGLRKNAETFQYCYDLLASKEQVLIMAEGFTTQQKRLAPLQKGAARMALGAAQGRKLDNLLVIPLGANFTKANKFRGEVMIEVGEPLKIKDYITDYKKDKKGTIDRLTVDMTVAMRSTIVHIENTEDDALFEKVIPIARRNLKSNLWPSWDRKDDRFRIEKKIADRINSATTEEKLEIAKLANSYPSEIHLRSSSSFINWIVIILGFPFWLIGVIYRMIPFSIARGIVKNKVEQIEFESPMRFGMGALFTIPWILMMLVLIPFCFGWQWIWLPLFMVPVIGFSVVYEDLWEVVQHGHRWSNLSNKEKETALSIEKQIMEW